MKSFPRVQPANRSWGWAIPLVSTPSITAATSGSPLVVGRSKVAVTVNGPGIPSPAWPATAVSFTWTMRTCQAVPDDAPAVAGPARVAVSGTRRAAASRRCHRLIRCHRVIGLPRRLGSSTPSRRQQPAQRRALAGVAAADPDGRQRGTVGEAAGRHHDRSHRSALGIEPLHGLVVLVGAAVHPVQLEGIELVDDVEVELHPR